MTDEAFAPAKINLTLHVTGRRADGYHLLESLVVFADVGDRLTASPAADLSLRVVGPFAHGVPTDDTNLVLRAAAHLRGLRGVTRGAHLDLEKNLPHGGGIGGGSGDAAAAFRQLADLWQVAPLTTAEALPLGADVPVCLHAPRPMIMRGVGDVLTPAPKMPAGWLVLVNPGVAVPTGRVFTRLDESHVGGAPMEPLQSGLDQDGFPAWLSRQRNDLTKAASGPGIAPIIADVLAALEPHAEAAGMSGSGSTCWGWFRTPGAARDAAQALSASRPGWWVRAARILGVS